MDFLIGFILIILGVATMRYRYELHNITGNWGWAETYLSGTVNAIILIGMIGVMVGTAFPLGAFEGFFDAQTFEPPKGK